MATVSAEPVKMAALLGGKAKAAILLALVEHPRVSISELARQTSVSKSTVTGALEKLEASGLVVLEASGNEKLADLTPDTRWVAEAIVSIEEPSFPTISEEMSEDDLEKIALYFATPSGVPARDDDWHEDQRALPVSRSSWEGRGALD